MTFIGSGGLRVLVEFCKTIDPGHVLLFNPQSQVANVLNLTGVLRGTNLILGYAN